MRPLPVAAVPTGGGRRVMPLVTAQPLRHVVVVELLAPDHPGEGLALDEACILVREVVLQTGVEAISLGDTRREDRVEILERRSGGGWREPQPELDLSAGRHLEPVPGRGLGAGALAVHGGFPAADHALVKAALEETGTRVAVQTAGAAVVVAVEERRPDAAREARGAAPAS